MLYECGNPKVIAEAVERKISINKYIINTAQYLNMAEKT